VDSTSGVLKGDLETINHMLHEHLADVVSSLIVRWVRVTEPNNLFDSATVLGESFV
jgi:hypothetical protein